MTTSIDNAELKNDVSIIEQKRQILEKVVDITRAIESMQESLNAVLVLGVASKDLPEDALSLYSSLSGSLRNLPVNKVKEYYSNLEILVKKQLNKILGYSGVDFSESDDVEFITLSSDSDEEDPLELLGSFKRTAQTAVSLRVLLRKRGVQTPGSAIPVTPEVIKQHLSHLDEQENTQRGKIKTKIEEMKQEIGRMIDNPAYPDAMKSMLKDVVDNLDKDLVQLARGASIERLSFVADAEEIVSVDDQALEVEEIVIDSVAATPEPVGFSQTAARWLNSPWDVGWDDIQKERP
ncbi:MAG: hypothetical protein KZQ85_14105 [Candidatus Thiodiazotropha sp. (ex Myrtea sp. 'scaly one' KF741663)]|nr:hypothetical protein [Candidatus Thiodiazotropha sp. (ex Myrtea sp. 'scaly one' KF741663)]